MEKNLKLKSSLQKSYLNLYNLIYIRDHAINQMEKHFGFSINKNDIKWVVTIPAI